MSILHVELWAGIGKRMYGKMLNSFKYGMEKNCDKFWNYVELYTQLCADDYKAADV